MCDLDNIHKSVDDYYSRKYREFGSTPKGVDWNSKESQQTRFDQLTKVITEDSFSLLDYGCGYGALYHSLNTRYQSFHYTGYDISDEMRRAASEHLAGLDNCLISGKESLNKTYDYLVASGIFNVMLDTKLQSWESYIYETLSIFNKLSTGGFSFNMLTSYSDQERMKDYLYYASPTEYFDFCKQNFSKNVALLHDYKLYEFTIIVRKN